MGIGDWGLGIKDWTQFPMPNTPTLKPNPPKIIIFFFLKNNFNYIYDKKII